MKTALLTLGLVAGLICLTVAGLYLLGRTQPANHTAAISFLLPRPRARVWAALTDYVNLPAWWPAVKAVRFETRPGGEIVTWNRDAHGREVGFRTREENAPTHLVREIVGDDLPFGGTWTYDLEEVAGGTKVNLREDGFVSSPLFRGIARVFLAPDATMRDFERHFTAYVTAK